MRILTLAALVAALVPSAVRADNAAQMVDAVIATVDKEVILYSDLMSQIGREIEELRRTAANQQEFLEKSDRLVKDSLDNSIERLLMAREAKKYPQLAVSDKELDEHIERIRKDQGATTEEFVRQIAGSMSEYREWVRTQIVASRMTFMKTRSFESEVTVADGDVNEYYETHREKYEHPERIYVRRIFLRVQGDEGERERVHAKLALLRDEILNGASFEELAKMHSQAPDAELGGAVGWSQRGDFEEPLDSAAFALPAGGLSDLLDTQFGVTLLKVDKREEAGTATLADVRLEIEEAVRKEGADAKYRTWLADLRKRSRVRVFMPQ